MNELLEFIADHIEKECNTKVNFGQLPDEPANVVVMNWKSGIKPKFAFSNLNSYRRRPFLMVEVRNSDYFAGLELSNDICRELERLYGEQGTRYILSITPTSDILENGRDDKNNYRYLQNFIVDFKED